MNLAAGLNRLIELSRMRSAASAADDPTVTINEHSSSLQRRGPAMTAQPGSEPARQRTRGEPHLIALDGKRITPGERHQHAGTVETR